MSLVSALENSTDDLSGKAMGLYSYGSGAVAEFFSGEVQGGYQTHLHTTRHRSLIDDRSALTYDEYLELWHAPDPRDGSSVSIAGNASASSSTRGRFQLTGISDHKRHYEAIVS